MKPWLLDVTAVALRSSLQPWLPAQHPPKVIHTRAVNVPQVLSCGVGWGVKVGMCLEGGAFTRSLEEHRVMDTGKTQLVPFGGS